MRRVLRRIAPVLVHAMMSVQDILDLPLFLTPSTRPFIMLPSVEYRPVINDRIFKIHNCTQHIVRI